MPISTTTNKSILTCTYPQESTGKIDENIFVDDPGDIDLEPILETPADAIAALDEDDRRSSWSEKVTEPKLDRSEKVIDAWSEKVTTDAARPLSEKVTRRFRTSDAHDRQIIDRIHKYVVPAATSEMPSLVEIFKPSIPTSTPPSKILGVIEKVRAANDNLPDWEFTRARAKLTLANEALAVLAGSGMSPVSWTLNLSPDRIEEAQRDRKGFVDNIKRDIDRALKRSLGFIPLYWFAVDVEKGRLHLHGGMLASTNDFPGIDEALCHAGGKWASTKGRGHQLHLDADRCDEGWIDYALRNKASVKRLIAGPMYTITTPLRREAQWTYNSYRKIMRGKAA